MRVLSRTSKQVLGHNEDPYSRAQIKALIRTEAARVGIETCCDHKLLRSFLQQSVAYRLRVCTKSLTSLPIRPGGLPTLMHTHMKTCCLHQSNQTGHFFCFYRRSIDRHPTPIRLSTDPQWKSVSEGFPRLHWSCVRCQNASQYSCTHQIILL